MWLSEASVRWSGEIHHDWQMILLICIVGVVRVGLALENQRFIFVKKFEYFSEVT